MMDDKYKRKPSHEKIEMAVWDLLHHMCDVVEAPYNVINSHSNWFYDYEWTNEERNDFVAYGIDLLSRNKICSKRNAKKEMRYFDLTWGWKVKNENGVESKKTYSKNNNLESCWNN